MSKRFPSLFTDLLPARIMKPMGKDLRRLVGTVKVGIAFRDGVRRGAGVSVDVHSQNGSSEITVDDNTFIQCKGNHLCESQQEL